MYAFKSIVIIITALSAGTLALPTEVTRRSLASIGGYWDSECWGDPVVGEPAKEDGTPVLANPTDDGKFKCITFNTPAGAIGVNFGQYMLMRAYNDAHCSKNHWLGYVSYPDPKTSWQGMPDDRGRLDNGTYIGTKVCVDQIQNFGGWIQSVRFEATRDAKEGG